MLYFYFQSQSTECMCSSRKIQSIIEQGNIETFILGAKIIAPHLQEMLNKYSKYNLRHREAVDIHTVRTPYGKILEGDIYTNLWKFQDAQRKSKTLFF